LCPVGCGGQETIKGCRVLAWEKKGVWRRDGPSLSPE